MIDTGLTLTDHLQIQKCLSQTMYDWAGSPFIRSDDMRLHSDLGLSLEHVETLTWFMDDVLRAMSSKDAAEEVFVPTLEYHIKEDNTWRTFMSELLQELNYFI